MTKKKKKPKSGGKVCGEMLRAIRMVWFGGICMNKDCGSDENLELAHAIPTQLTFDKPSGWRSSYERLQDVLENPECFLLLCRRCHNKYDERDSKSFSRRRPKACAV